MSVELDTNLNVGQGVVSGTEESNITGFTVTGAVKGKDPGALQLDGE